MRLRLEFDGRMLESLAACALLAIRVVAEATASDRAWRRESTGASSLGALQSSGAVAGG